MCRRCINLKRNARAKEVEEISKCELEEMKKQNHDLILLDVRSPQEYDEGHLNGSILIPSYDINKKAKKVLLDKNAIIVVCCQSGTRSKKVANQLKQMGYEFVYNLRNGIEEL